MRDDDQRSGRTVPSATRRRASCTCASTSDGDHITIEPWRAAAFPMVKDLIVDRSRVRPHHRGGRLHRRRHRRRARRQRDPDSEAGLRRGDGRGRVHRLRCVRRRVSRTAPRSCSRRRSWSTSTCCRRVRPSGGTARRTWSRRWRRYFGSCTNHRECEAACPKSISIDFIALMNRDYVKAQFKQRRLVGQTFP